MSVAVSLEELRDEIARRGEAAFLLTVGDDGRPHSVAVATSWVGDALVMGAGRGTRANAAARPLVSLLWPPAEPAGYSLIVDGSAGILASGDGDVVAVTPTKAVLHRPGPGSSPGCTSDCRPVGSG
jgi:hypothetical protein